MNSLLARLMAILCLALLPALGLQAYSELCARDARHRLMHDEAVRLADRIRAEQREVIHAAAQVVLVLARAPAVRQARADLCPQLLAGVLEGLPRYLSAMVIGRDGHPRCSARPMDPALDVADRAFFHRALDSGGPVVGDYVTGLQTGRKVIHIAAPFEDMSGQVAGVVALSLSADWLQRHLDSVQLPPGAVAAITDRAGVVLARVPDGPHYVGQPLTPDARLAPDAGDAAVVADSPGLDGVPRLIAYAPPGDDPLGLGVAVGLDRRIAFADVLAANRSGMLLIAGGLGAALLVAFLLARRLIARPVARLLDVAERWRAGDLAARSGLPPDHSEFGRLAAAFEEAAAALAKREQALHVALASTPDAVIVFDRAFRYRYLNEPACALLGRRDLVGQVIWDVFPQARATRIGRALRQAMDSGLPVQADGFNVTLQRHLQINAYPSADGLTLFCRDLTDERRTAAALRDSEARLQLAREAAGFGVWDRDYLTATAMWSEALWRLYGLAPRDGAPDEAQWEAALHPDDRERMKALRAAFRAGTDERCSAEYRVVHPDGSVHWLADKIRMVRDADGWPLRAVGVTLDVTEQRRTEEALRLATERFELAIKTTPISLFTQDRALRFTWVYNALRGFDAGRMIGRTEAEVFDRAEDAAAVAAIKRAVMDSGVGQRHEVTVWSQGAECRFDLLVEPLRDRDGRIEGVTCASIDITERTRIAAELATVTAELREAQRIAHIGNWTWDAVADTRVVSDEVARILGLDPRRPVPTRAEQRGENYPEESWQRIDAALRAAMEQGRGFDLDLEARRGGVPIWVNLRGETMRDADGRAVGVRGTLQDITERHALEMELRRLTRTLERRVAEEVAAREAAQMRAAHAERMQALGQLAGGIAHDFNNVLQAISGAMTMIGRRPGDEAGIRRLTQLASEATARGAAITRRLLAFGRRADLRAEPIDAAALLADLRDILLHTLGRGIDIQIAPGDGLASFVADKSQLETALINLATNARDAMPGGGRLTLSAAEEVVPPGGPRHPAGLAPGRYVRLDVADTGTGMDAATLARASEPFFTTKKLGAGTGLGLAMTKGFVEQSGGGLAIDSRVGQGTTVTLWLPGAAPADVPAAPPPEHAAAAPRTPARPRVLLVDDESSVREVLAMELEDAGYSVLAAASGHEALALLRAGEQVAAMVTDLSMPDMDGVTLIRAVQEGRHGLPAVLLTGYAGDGAALAVGGAVSGAFSLLRKPVGGLQLVDRLDALLADRAAVE